tara:strand:+ start:576 stop:971 length:396 start_codon:yes stop_codon:yes gene_type:complete
MHEIKEKRTHVISRETFDEWKEVIKSIEDVEKGINRCVEYISYADSVMRKIKQSENRIVSMRNYLIIRKCESVIQLSISAAGDYEKSKECYSRLLDNVQSRMKWDLLSHLNSIEIPQLEKKSVPNLSVIEG